jgi:hypothetical protein
MAEARTLEGFIRKAGTWIEDQAGLGQFGGAAAIYRMQWLRASEATGYGLKLCNVLGLLHLDPEILPMGSK